MIDYCKLIVKFKFKIFKETPLPLFYLIKYNCISEQRFLLPIVM